MFSILTYAFLSLNVFNMNFLSSNLFRLFPCPSTLNFLLPFSASKYQDLQGTFCFRLMVYVSDPEQILFVSFNLLS